MTHDCTRTASLATHNRAAVVEAARELYQPKDGHVRCL